MEIDLWHSRITELENRIEELKANHNYEIKQLMDNMMAQAGMQSRYLEQIEQLKEANSELHTQLEEYQFAQTQSGKTVSQTSEIHNYNKKIAQLEAENIKLQQRLSELEKEINLLVSPPKVSKKTASLPLTSTIIIKEPVIVNPLLEKSSNCAGHTLKLSHAAAVMALAFSSDNRVLATGTRNGYIKLWNVALAKEIKTLSDPLSQIFHLNFSPNGTLLASCGEDKFIKLWDFEQGEILTRLTGHTKSVIAFCFSPVHTNMASISLDKTIIIWNLENGKILHRIETPVTQLNLIYTKNGNFLISGGVDGIIRFWDIRFGKQVAQIEAHSKHRITDLAISNSEQLLASVSNDKMIKLWDLNNNSLWQIIRGHEDEITSVAFSPDESKIATGGKDSIIKTWYLFNGQEIETLDYHAASVHAMIFSPDSSYLASGSWDNTVRLAYYQKI